MKRNFALQGLDCANCAAKAERAIAKIAGVTDATINFMTLKLMIEYDEAHESEILTEVQKALDKTGHHVTMKKA